jgi:glycosyltransferase involved in cell wall biosynthesis
MEVRNGTVTIPFFSICIPQYNRTSFLIEACKVLAQQTCQDFEICISDDQSTDGREQELIDYLQQSGLSFIYKRQAQNQRYDGNIRASIDLAQGKYCLLHGNDDCLASETTLAQLAQAIQQNNFPAVITTNFEDWKTGEQHRRIRSSKLVGSGVEVAVTHFRNVAFVTGVMVERAKAQACATDRWDGSEMYQMYVIAKLIAEGGILLELDTSVARRDIQIPDETVDSYVKPRLNPCPIVERKLPMGLIGLVIADAVALSLSDSSKNLTVEKIFWQLYLFTYPYWIIEYRRVQFWNYAVGICLGIKPKNTFLKVDLSLLTKIRLYCLYLAVCITGLLVPVNIYDRLKSSLYIISKSLFAKTEIA